MNEDTKLILVKIEALTNAVVGIKDEVAGVKSGIVGIKDEVAGIKETMATKQDLEALAISTAKGFAEVNKNISNLNEKVDDVEKNLIDQIEDLARMTNGALAAKQDKFVYA